MQASLQERFSRGTSLVHRLDPRLKIALTLPFVVWVVLTPIRWWPVYVLQAVVALTVYGLSRLPWRLLAVRLVAIMPFLLLIAGAVPLARAFEGGWDVAGQVFIRALLALTVMVTLVSTTPLPRLLAALAWFRVPALFLSILAFMYRYMFVLVEELSRMRRAKLARTSYPSLTGEVGLMANFVGILFIRAFERAERVYAAMCARGWTGKYPD